MTTMEQMTCHIDWQFASAAISASTARLFDRIDPAKWLGIAQENCVLRLIDAGAMNCEVYFAMAGYRWFAPASAFLDLPFPRHDAQIVIVRLPLRFWRLPTRFFDRS
jgi:hypothetical protein